MSGCQVLWKADNSGRECLNRADFERSHPPGYSGAGLKKIVQIWAGNSRDGSTKQRGDLLERYKWFIGQFWGVKILSESGVTASIIRLR